MLFITKNIFESSKQTVKEITGSSVGVVSINIMQACTISLVNEFNFISLCANSTDMSIANVLSSIAGKYDFVLRWNKTRQEFDTYSPEASENGFNGFEMNESYFIFMKEASTLGLSGDEPGDMNISMGQEFNPPSYPYLFSGNVSRYINPIASDVSFVLKWNKTAQEFVTYAPEAAVQQFDMIDSGEGQFIFVLTPTVLRYNKTLLQS